jgi:hypothetical protein
MSGRTMVIGLAAVFVVAVGVTSAGTSGSGAVAQTPGQGRAGARAEKRDRGWVSVRERIALGVEEPTWIKKDGKVHPDVGRALAYQKQLEGKLEKESDWIDVVDTEGPEAFLGYAYVVVHLEYSPKEKGDSESNRAAIRKLQDSVLSGLTAVDFRYWLRFPERPAIIGFVNEGGLKKLAENKDVRAVGLDDKPYPNLHQAQFYQQGSDAVNGVLLKISPQVAAALDKADEVYVWVGVRAQDAEEERTVQSFKRGRALNDGVLARLSAQEFDVTSVSDVVPHFRGWLPKAGLGKLAEDADVRNVGLPAEPPRTDGQGRRRP